jgi:hypothetical protein
MGDCKRTGCDDGKFCGFLKPFSVTMKFRGWGCMKNTLTEKDYRSTSWIRYTFEDL